MADLPQTPDRAPPPSPASGKNDPRSFLMMIASLVIVGSIGVFRRYLPLSSALLACLRGAVGGAFLLLIPAGSREHRSRPDRRKLAVLLLGGVFLGINWMLLFEAFNYTTIAKATLCYYLAPTIVVLLSPLVFRERLTAIRLMCAFGALTGMVLVSGALQDGLAQSRELRGILLGLGAACFYAMVIITNKRVQGVDARQKTVIQLLTAAVSLVPYVLLTGGFRQIPLDLRTLILLAIVCIVHTGIAYALYFGSMDGLRAQTISALSYIDPVVAMILSAAVLGEHLSWQGILGAVLILGCALIGEMKTGSGQ